MNLPMVLPEVEYANYKVTGSWGNWGSNTRSLPITPYPGSSQRDKAPGIIARHKIVVPFTQVITRDMGTSVCPKCGAKYAGHELECNKPMTWYKTRPESYASYCRGDVVLGEIIPGEGMVLAVEQRPCGTETQWDLAAQFEEQKAFFEFVDLLGRIPEERSDLIARFRHCLPAGVEDKHRITLLEQQVDYLNIEMNRAHSAIRLIAEKMNSAGHSLVF